MCVCAFSHFHRINLYFHRVVEHGAQGLQGLWVCAKTIIKDRDCRRLCENVFMYVCMGRRQGSLSGRDLIPSGRVSSGREESVHMQGVRGWRALHRCSA